MIVGATFQNFGAGFLNFGAAYQANGAGFLTFGATKFPFWRLFTPILADDRQNFVRCFLYFGACFQLLADFVFWCFLEKLLHVFANFVFCDETA